jgi:hypothetical protein
MNASHARRLAVDGLPNRSTSILSSSSAASLVRIAKAVSHRHTSTVYTVSHQYCLGTLHSTW